MLADCVCVWLQGAGKLVFFNRELKQVYQCSVGECVSTSAIDCGVSQ